MEPVYRLATVDDKRGILAIGDVYDGLDYLSYRIDYYLGDASNYRNVVAVVDGAVVGYTAGLLLDGGQSVVTKATRVLADWRCRGVAKRLVEIAIELTKTDQTKFEIIVVNNTNAVYSKPGKEDYVNIMEMDIFIYPHTKASTVPSRNHSSIKTMTVSMLQDILSDKASCSRLFPRKLLCVDSAAFELMPHNGDKILTEVTEGFCSYGPGGGKCSVITFTYRWVCPIGYVYGIAIYGNDSQLVEDHFRFHIERSQECSNQDLPEDRKQAPIVFGITADVINSDTVTSTMERMGFEISPSKYTKGITFRRKM